MVDRRNFSGGLSLFLFVLLTASSIESAQPVAEGLECVTPAALNMDAQKLGLIDAIAAGEIAMSHTPGMVVAIGRGNKICLLKAYGNRQLYPKIEPMTTDTLFDLASVTKVACSATAINVLIDRGLVSSEDKITRFFPEFGTCGKDRITIRHCLTHTSGLKNYDNHFRGTKEEIWQKVCELEPPHVPGAKYEYLDTNTVILGKVAEKVSGQNLRDFTLSQIYRPLGMNSTMFRPTLELRKRAGATETRPVAWARERLEPEILAELVKSKEKPNEVWFKGVVNDYRCFELGGIAGHTGLFSTGPDLAILAATVLGHGTLVRRDGTSVKLFGEETYRAMIASYMTPENIRGLGWDKRSNRANRSWRMTPDAIGHGGWTGTSIWIDPGLNLFVVVLGNRRHPDGSAPNIYPAAARIATIAAGAILDLPDVPSRQLLRKNSVLPCSSAVKELAKKHAISADQIVATDNFQFLRGKKIGLITTRKRLEASDGFLVQLKKAGIEVVVAFYADPEYKTNAMNLNAIPVKKETFNNVTTYALGGDYPRILPLMLQGAQRIVFDSAVMIPNPPGKLSEQSFAFAVNVLGQTMQTAADYSVDYVVLDSPQVLARKRILAGNLDELLAPFANYARDAVEFGLTLGELSLVIHADQRMKSHLTIVPVAGYRRESVRKSIRWSAAYDQCVIYP
ncbi:MAG: serine hydrolase [Thermoguttaceae bacterium]|nr:serine hydrolase [Thermoguttaceae bacterium]